MCRPSRRVLAVILLLAGAACGARPVLAASAGKPQGTRTLILIRHGAYEDKDQDAADTTKVLTAAGREQARITARRLAALPVKIDAVHTSTLSRAHETAALISEILGGPAPRGDDDLVECMPPAEGKPPESPAANDCRRAIERDFARYFRPSPERDRTELIVAHGNVIRMLVTLTLGIEPECWRRLTIANCSLTVVRVAADGAMKLVAYGDMGHLPPSLQSFASTVPVWGEAAGAK